MKIFLSIFIILFSTSVLASYDQSEYQGKKALMDKQYSLDIGWNLEWLKDCANNFESNKLKNRIKKISYADFKNVQKGIAEWRSGTGKASGCSQSGDTIKGVEDYISDLKLKTSIKSNSKTSNNSNNNKTTESLVGNYKGELIYPNGERLKIDTKIYKSYSKLFGDYSFKDFDGTTINGKLSDFIINGESIEAKWKDKYGNGWLKVFFRNNNFQGSWGLINNGKYEITGKWTGRKTSKTSTTISLNNKKLIFKKEEYTNKNNNKIEDVYYGEFQNDKRHGIGKYTWDTGSKNADYYIGEFKFDKKHGNGKYFWPRTGSSFCGLYINDDENSGITIYDKRSGENKRDIFKGDKLIKGFGVYYFTNGDYDVGEWENNKINGFARQYNSDGSIYKEGIFKDDELITERKVAEKIIGKAREAERRAEENCKKAEEIIKIPSL